MNKDLKGVISALIISIGVLVILIIVGLTIKYFAQPASRSIDQKTFMESQQYIDSSVRDLQHYMLEYQKADETQKEVIKNLVQHQFANFPEDKVPTYLKPFYIDMMIGVQK